LVVSLASLKSAGSLCVRWQVKTVDRQNVLAANLPAATAVIARAATHAGTQTGFQAFIAGRPDGLG
jgi:hypothetical protein